jgi:D,D-heptose 1,7-bisphosphate phosphatase
MQAVILAGGKGTRLGRPDLPKPLVRIGEQTLLEHQIAWLRRHGLDEVFVLTGHLAPVIFDHLRDGSGHGVRLTHAIEPYPLGTAGSVALVKHLLRDRFLVVYGDVMLDMDLERLIDFDRCEESLGTLVVHPNAHPYDSDLLEVDEQGTVTAFHPKPRPPHAFYHNLVNAGVYILHPEVVANIPFGKSLDFGRDVLPALVRDGGRLRGYRTTEFLHDVGTPDRLHHVTQDYLQGKIARLNRRHRRRAVFLDRDGVVVRHVDHLSRAEDLELMDGVGEAIASLNGSEYLAVLVTNQPMIAKGFLTTAKLRELHRKMETVLGLQHAYLDGVYFCPHHPARGFPGEVLELKVPCACRKPQPGMLQQAAQELNIDLPASWMIGDQDSDMLAGKRAGCRTIQVSPPGAASPWADHAAGSLLEAVRSILAEDTRCNVRKESA